MRFILLLLCVLALFGVNPDPREWKITFKNWKQFALIVGGSQPWIWRFCLSYTMIANGLLTAIFKNYDGPSQLSNGAIIAVEYIPPALGMLLFFPTKNILFRISMVALFIPCSFIAAMISGAIVVCLPSGCHP
jgi:hypothetical protein